jgi:hypothetical protein
MAEPPSFTGAVNHMIPPVLIGVTIKFVGASATEPNAGVTDNADDGQDVPIEFIALILMLYADPFVSPVIVIGLK